MTCFVALALFMKKYVRRVERIQENLREDEEFRRAKEEEVSTSFSSNLAMNTELWLGWILSPRVR